jgi:hypothetical protein
VPNPESANGWDSKSTPKTIPAPPDAAELICLKARSGPDGWTIPLRWDGDHQRFADPDEADPSKYLAPTAPSARALEGARVLAELRAKFATPQPALEAPAVVVEDRALTVGALLELEEGGDASE